MDLQVTCVTTEDASRHEGITHLGGAGWNKTRRQVISDIEGGINSYYTFDGRRRANVRVVDGLRGKYVQTYADGVLTDNLLRLPSCP